MFKKLRIGVYVLVLVPMVFFLSINQIHGEDTKDTLRKCIKEKCKDLKNQNIRYLLKYTTDTQGAGTMKIRYRFSMKRIRSNRDSYCQLLMIPNEFKMKSKLTDSRTSELQQKLGKEGDKLSESCKKEINLKLKLSKGWRQVQISTAQIDVAKNMKLNVSFKEKKTDTNKNAISLPSNEKKAYIKQILKFMFACFKQKNTQTGAENKMKLVWPFMNELIKISYPKSATLDDTNETHLKYQVNDTMSVTRHGTEYKDNWKGYYKYKNDNALPETIRLTDQKTVSSLFESEPQETKIQVQLKKQP